MSTSADRSIASASESAAYGYRAAGDVDVTGMLLNRASDLYAQQERERRVSRTQRMIKRAESLK